MYLVTAGSFLLLCHRSSQSNWRNFRIYYVTRLQLGDRRPSDLLEEMKQLAGERIHNSVLGEIWRQRLPQAVQEILSATPQSTELGELARVADRIREVGAQRGASTIQAVTTQDASNALTTAVTALTQLQVRDVSRVDRSRSRSSNRASRRPSSESFPVALQRGAITVHVTTTIQRGVGTTNCTRNVPVDAANRDLFGAPAAVGEQGECWSSGRPLGQVSRPSGRSRCSVR